MSRRFSTKLRFISALDEHAGHSRLASVTQLQSRQITAWMSGMMDLLIIVCMVVSSFLKPSRSNLDRLFLFHDSCKLKERRIFAASECIDISSPSHSPSAGHGSGCLSAHGVESEITVRFAPVAVDPYAVSRSRSGAFRLPMRDSIISFTFSKGLQP